MIRQSRALISCPVIPVKNNLSIPIGGNVSFVYSFSVISIPAQQEHPFLQQELYSLTVPETPGKMFPVGSGARGCLFPVAGLMGFAHAGRLFQPNRETGLVGHIDPLMDEFGPKRLPGRTIF
jgi:hypothetical protein